MRRPIVIMVTALGLAIGLLGTTAGGTAAQSGDATGIQSAIRGQMQAFVGDDFESAFAYASPGIRRIFGDAERFGGMVRSGYPMVHRPADIRFLDLREIGGRPWQKVMVRDAGGTFHILDYEMELGPDGGWRIDGVRLLEAEQVGA